MEETQNKKTLQDAYKENLELSESNQKYLLSVLISGIKDKYDAIYKVKEDWFLNKRLRRIYSLVKESITLNKETINYLISNGEKASEITTLLTDGVSHGIYLSIDNLVESLSKSYKRDKFYHLLDEFSNIYSHSNQDPDTMIQKAYTSLMDIATNDENTKNIDEIFEEFYKVQEQFLNKPEGSYIGIPTGFSKLDKIIDGLRDGHFWIIGAYTSAGKTWFGLNIINNIIADSPTCMFSLEMSRVEILNRLLAIETNIPATLILRNEISDEEKERVTLAKERMINSHFRIYDRTTDLSEIILMMTYEIIKKKTKVFLIDYLQLIAVKNTSGDYEETSAVSKKLQSFARDMGVTIIVLSQINNEHAKTPNKEVLGFKGGGTIGASADIAIELVNVNTKEERDERYANNQPYEVTAIIKKNRHGRTGEIDMEFTPKTGVFKQVDHQSFAEFGLPPDSE